MTEAPNPPITDSYPDLKALKINGDTYPIYKKLPLAYHYDEHLVNNEIIVFDQSLPNKFGYFTMEDFDTWYRFEVLPASKIALSSIVRVENADD